MDTIACIGFTNDETQELMIIQQGIDALDELGLLSSSNITEISIAVINQRDERAPITELMKLNILKLW